MLDAHCHILPKLDDGVKSQEEAHEILTRLKDFDINNVIFTSHIKYGFAKYEDHVTAYKQIKPIAEKYGVQTLLGFEVGWKYLAEINDKSLDKYCFENSKFFLLEFSFSGIPVFWEQIIKKLQLKGFEIIIAHPERFANFSKNIIHIKKMHDMGCYMMLSANFIVGKFLGINLKKNAKMLLKENLVDMICSDAHSIHGYSCLAPAYKFAAKYGFEKDANEKLLGHLFD